MGFPKVTQLLAGVICVALAGDTAAASRRRYPPGLLHDRQYRNAPDSSDYITAACVMQVNSALPASVQAANDVVGTVSFKQLRSGGPLEVTVDLAGLDSSGAVLHGFHVHESGDMSNGCDSTGGHFNPSGKHHGGPGDEDRHAGDFGNVERHSDGTVHEDLTDEVASLLAGTNNIIGKAIVLHKDTDDLGRGDEADSLTTGHAGARLACCVIAEP